MPRPRLLMRSPSTPHPAGAANCDRQGIAVRTAWRTAIRRWSRAFGSLPMAVVLLTLFALALSSGIYAESTYGPTLAQQVIYETWWFSLLLGILGVNIFCAAAKKWPWQKRQTGFLITHTGLLMLVAGGFLSSQFGVHGVMNLIDTEDVRFHSF